MRVGVTISDYLTGVFAAHAAACALYARDARGGSGAVIDAALYGAALRVLEWTLAAYDRLGIVRNREGNRLANSAPLDNYPTRDGKYVCIVAGSDANFARLCKAMDRTDLLDDARFTQARRSRRARRRDQRHRRGVDRDPRRHRDRRPLRRPRRAGRDRVHRGRHLRRPAHGRPRRSRDGRRSRHRCGPPAGTVPRQRRRAAGRAHGRAAASAPTRARCLGALGLSDAELDDLADPGNRVIPDGLFETARRRHDRPHRRLLPDERAATTSRCSTPARTPARPTSNASCSRATRPLWAWTAVTAAPPGYDGPVPYGFGIVELTKERLRIVTRLREADPAQLTFGQPMQLVADALPNGMVTWAFA